MNEKSMLETLRDISFLSSVGTEHLERLAELGKFVEFPADKIIFRDCQPASHCYLIIDGSVSLEICAPGIGCKRILTVGEGELLGWSSVLGKSRLTSTARTLTATRAIELSGRQVLDLCEHNPDFGYEFMQRTALALEKRLTATRLKLLDMVGTEEPAAGQSE